MVKASGGKLWQSDKYWNEQKRYGCPDLSFIEERLEKLVTQGKLIEIKKGWNNDYNLWEIRRSILKVAE